MTAIEDIANSRARLTIASLISTRPRTLGELAETTGISVQGVLKHLKKISELGIVERTEIGAGDYLRPRKLYFIASRKVADYSQGEMIVATLVNPTTQKGPNRVEDAYAELDSLAQDVILLRRRARELSERLRRMISEVTESELRISKIMEGLPLTPEEKQIGYLIFGDDRPEQVRRTLRMHYGCEDPDSAVSEVMEKIRGRGD